MNLFDHVVREVSQINCEFRTGMLDPQSVSTLHLALGRGFGHDKQAGFVVLDHGEPLRMPTTFPPLVASSTSSWSRNSAIAPTRPSTIVLRGPRFISISSTAASRRGARSAFVDGLR